MECLLALADEFEAVADDKNCSGAADALPQSSADGDQDAFAALLELADQEDSCASRDLPAVRPPTSQDKSEVATGQPSQDSKKKGRHESRSDAAVRRPQKKRRSFTDSKENDCSATNTAVQARPQHAQKQTAAFTSALTKDERNAADGRTAQQAFNKKHASAPTQEKFSGLRMKNPVLPSVVLQERMSMLQFLRLTRTGERVDASDASQWATIAVLTEKSKPRQSSSGQAFSMWKVSDLAGVTLTLFLFGDAHQSLYRESEGSVMAICNARVSADSKGGLSMKVQDPSSIYKLGTSADFALCGAKKKDGSTCCNAVNVSVCRFCDYHVQGEYRRLNSTRGPLMTATVGARLSDHAKAAAKRQAQPQQPRYVPPMPDMQQLDSAAASFNSQGARHIAGINRKEPAGTGKASAAEHQFQAGKQKEWDRAEPKAYLSHAPLRQAPGLSALPSSSAAQQASRSRPVPLVAPTSAGAGPARSALADRQSKHGPSAQPQPLSQHAVRQAGGRGGKQAPGTQHRSSQGPRPQGAQASKEAVVLLEETEIDWDLGDLQKVQQRARDVPRLDSDEEEERGRPIAPQPVSPVRTPAAPAPRVSARSQPAMQAERAEGMLKAIQIIQSKGGIKAMRAEQAAARKHNPALAAARASASAGTSSAGPPVTDSEVPQQSAGSAAESKPALEPRSFFRAQQSRQSNPAGSSARAPGAPAAGAASSRQRITAKLGLAPKSALGKKPAGAAKPKAVTCTPGQSAFAAAFGDALKDVDLQQTGTRYKAVIEDEEHGRLDALLGTLQRKDEAQQRMEVITQLTVTAWRCATCACTTDRRRTACQGHEGKSVTVTKRWWTCAGCNHRFSTLGVKYPTKRCPNPRCSAPESEFKKAGMAPAKVKSSTVAGESVVASREDFRARGTEHSFALK